MTDETQIVLELLSEHGGLKVENSEEMRATELTKLGIGSATFMLIIVELEDALGRPFEDADVFAEVKTLRDLLQALGVE
jgi:acyl carrier protein